MTSIPLRRAPGSSTPACANCPEKSPTAALIPENRSPPLSSPRSQNRTLSFTDCVYGNNPSSLTRSKTSPCCVSDGFPTYHLASCVDDADLRISHIIRGQDHLTNTFKHLLIFEALRRAAAPVRSSSPARCPRWRQALQAQARPRRQRDHLPRRRLPPSSLVNFLCLLGWSPKNDREFHAARRTARRFTFEAVNRSNAVINFTEEDPFDPKAVWLNAEHIRALPVEQLSPLLPALLRAGWPSSFSRKAPRRHPTHSRAHQAA